MNNNHRLNQISAVKTYSSIVCQVCLNNLPLYCPFCHATEDERVEAMDFEGNKVLLVMFDCPFYFRFFLEHVGSEEMMQQFLDDWKSSKGEEWLESVGPVMKAREMKNIERYKSSRTI